MQTKLKKCDGCEKDKPIWKNLTVDGARKRFCKNCWSLEQGVKGPAKPTKRSIISRSQKPIPKRSEKRALEEIEYSKKRKLFLAKHSVCKMNIKGICTTEATEVQHLKGRIGDLFLDEKFWMSSCSPCHRYATDHPEEAIENGWALPRLSEVRIDSKGRKIMGTSPDRTCMDCGTGFSFDLIDKDDLSPCCKNLRYAGVAWED